MRLADYFDGSQTKTEQFQQNAKLDNLRSCKSLKSGLEWASKFEKVYIKFTNPY